MGKTSPAILLAIQNNGDRTLRVNSNKPPRPFACHAADIPYFVVTPGQGVTLPVTFKPKQKSRYDVGWNLSTNDPAFLTIGLTLRGRGI